MCLLLFIWAAMSEAGNSNELILCSRGNFVSSFHVAVLMRTRFNIVFDALEETFKVLDILQIDWPLCLKV
jgi:hypothetical protein